MAVKLKSNAKAFAQWAARRIDAYLSAITLEVHRLALKAASVPNPGQVRQFSKAERARRKGGKFKNKTQRTVYPFPSRPGESPRMRTGFGRKNIVMGYSRTLKEGRVGYTRLARYMTYHELGIRYRRVGTQQRPTIMPVVRGEPRRLIAVGRAAMRRVR